MTAVKSFQSRRFSGTYWDLLSTEEYGAAAHFFLVELYSEKDYSQRDAQFARIAGALQRIFPEQVVDTAVALAELHVLTEEFDHAMAKEWSQVWISSNDEVDRYLRAWRLVGRSNDRFKQLDLVLRIGSELERLTRTPGLRMMLRMMRRPASATGLGALQSFLELGFDTFEIMSRKRESTNKFLEAIHDRESEFMRNLFSADREIGLQTLVNHLNRSGK